MLTTVPETTPVARFLANALSTLSLPWPLESANDVEVKLDGATLPAGVAYRVTPDPDGEGFTLDFDPPVTGTLEIRRHTKPRLPDFHVTSNPRVDKRLLQHQLARLTLVTQDHDALLGDVENRLRAVENAVASGTSGTPTVVEGGGWGGSGVDMVGVYGADPTGAVPIDAAVQQALSDGYRALFFREGTYLVGSKLVLPRRTAIVGAGRDHTKFVAADDLADFMFEFRYDPEETPVFHRVHNHGVLKDCWLHMAHSGALFWGHSGIVHNIRISGGDPAGVGVRMANSNEFYINGVYGGTEAGYFRLYASGLEIMAHDWSLEDLQQQDANGEWPGTSVGDGVLGTRDINYGDGVVEKVRLRVYATAPWQFGVRIAHESTKTPSLGENTPNSTAGVMNNVTVLNCQSGAEGDSPEATTFRGYSFRRVQRCLFQTLNAEFSGYSFYFEDSGAPGVGRSESSYQNVMVNCQGFNGYNTGITFNGFEEMPAILGGTYMYWRGHPYATDANPGEDSYRGEYNCSKKDTHLNGQVWLQSYEIGAPTLVIRSGPGGIREVVRGQLDGDGTSTDIVLDLPWPVDDIVPTLIQVATNPDFWPRLVEGTDYTWQLETVTTRYDRVRVTLTTPPASGQTVYARVIRNKARGGFQIVAPYQDTGRTDEFAGFWSTHPKFPYPTHALEIGVGENNATYIFKPCGGHARQDARIVIGNGPALNTAGGANGPLACIELADPLRLRPRKSIPVKHYPGLIITPEDRKTFPKTYSYWLGTDRPHVKVRMDRDGATTKGWDWVPLGWSHLERVKEFTSDRILDRNDLGRILIWIPNGPGTVTIPGDLLREDEVGENYVDSDGYRYDACGWLEIWNMTAGGVDDVTIAAGTGVTLKGVTTVPPHSRVKVLIKRTGPQQCTAFVAQG